MICVDLAIEELNSNIIFLDIDAKTTYNLLVGQPWIHGIRLLPSKLHPCLKFHKSGEVKKVEVDAKPFTRRTISFS